MNDQRDEDIPESDDRDAADWDPGPADPNHADPDPAAKAPADENSGDAQAPPKPDPNAPGIRADKWLWQARFFKSRTLAAKAIQGGIRLSGEKTDKPNRAVRVGDVLTFQQGRTIRVIRVQALGTRRGPAPEARTLFTDLDPPQPKPKGAKAPPPGAGRPKGAGRPTKRERRQLDKLHGTDDVI
jgi:ribosome-associated heat shock protein Hsp15